MVNKVKKQTKNVSLGLAQAFIDGVDVGWVEQVSANVEWDEFEFEQGAPLGTEALLRIRERASISLQHAEFSAERLALALPGAEESTGGELSNLEETIELVDEVPTALAAAAAGATGFETVSVAVFSPDRKTEYVAGTDYTFDGENSTIARIDIGGNIPNNSEVVVDSIYNDTAAKVVDFGGSRLCKAQSFHSMVLHHEKAQTCIPFEIKAHKVLATSPLNIQFAKDTIIVPEVTYRVFIDRTRPRGARLIRITEGSESLVTL